jgi:hypothetical protein
MELYQLDIACTELAGYRRPKPPLLLQKFCAGSLSNLGEIQVRDNGSRKPKSRCTYVRLFTPYATAIRDLYQLDIACTELVLFCSNVTEFSPGTRLLVVSMLSTLQTPSASHLRLGRSGGERNDALGILHSEPSSQFGSRRSGLDLSDESPALHSSMRRFNPSQTKEPFMENEGRSCEQMTHLIYCRFRYISVAVCTNASGGANESKRSRPI